MDSGFVMVCDDGPGSGKGADGEGRRTVGTYCNMEEEARVASMAKTWSISGSRGSSGARCAPR